MLIPIIAALEHQHVPKGCRKARATTSQEAVLIEVREVSAAEAPLICRARRTEGWATTTERRRIDALLVAMQDPGFSPPRRPRPARRMGWGHRPETDDSEDEPGVVMEEGAASASWMVWRRCGDQCWKLTADDPATEVTQGVQSCAGSWKCREKHHDQAVALMTSVGQEIAAQYLLVDGVAYTRCEEPGWQIDQGDNDYGPYQPSLFIADAVRDGRRGSEDHAGYRFRLDEYAEARRRLCRLMGRKRPRRAVQKRFPDASYKHRIEWTIAEMDATQLRRPKGMALVNAARLEAIREAAAKVSTKELVELLGDYLPDLLPPGTDLAAARLLEALNIFHETMRQGEPPAEDPAESAA